MKEYVTRATLVARPLTHSLSGCASLIKYGIQIKMRFSSSQKVALSAAHTRLPYPIPETGELELGFELRPGAIRKCAPCATTKG